MPAFRDISSPVFRRPSATGSLTLSDCVHPSKKTAPFKRAPNHGRRPYFVRRSTDGNAIESCYVLTQFSILFAHANAPTQPGRESMDKLPPPSAHDNNQSQHWDFQKATYQKLAARFDDSRVNRNHMNKILAINTWLQLPPAARVLEVGVGTGIHAEYILRAHPDITFYGVDISPDMLNVGAAKLGDKAILRCMRGEQLEFDSQFFDAAYISGSLHHFADPSAGIRELIRVLKINGRFCIMEPNIMFPTNFAAAHLMPSEKNQRQMTKRNFSRWLARPDVHFTLSNFAYTPPYPKFMIPVFDKVDATIARLPLLRNISVMLFICGVKILS